MEQKCPHCGFLQPQDEFCANCGIHIVKYQKQKKSLTKKKLTFYLSLFFSFFILFFLYFYFFPFQKSSEKVKISENNQASEVKEEKPNLMEKEGQKQTLEVSNSNQLKKTKSGLTELTEEKSNQKTSLRSKGDKESSKNKKKVKGVLEKKKNQIPHLRVLFAEIPKESVGRLFEEEESLSNRVLLVSRKKSLKNWVQTLNGKILPGGGLKKIVKGQEMSMSFLYTENLQKRRNPEGDGRIGLRIFVGDLERRGAGKDAPQFRRVDVNTDDFFENNPVGFYGSFDLSTQKFLLILGDFLENTENLNEEEEDRTAPETSPDTTEAGFDGGEGFNTEEGGPLDSSSIANVVSSIESQKLDVETVLILQFDSIQSK